MRKENKEIKLISIVEVGKGSDFKGITKCQGCDCTCGEDRDATFVKLRDAQRVYFLHEKCMKEIGKGRKTFASFPHDGSNYSNVAKRCIAHQLTCKVSYLNAIYFASFGWSVESVINQHKKLVVSPVARNAKATGKLVKSALLAGATTCNDEAIDTFEQFKELTDLLH